MQFDLTHNPGLFISLLYWDLSVKLWLKLNLTFGNKKVHLAAYSLKVWDQEALILRAGAFLHSV